MNNDAYTHTLEIRYDAAACLIKPNLLRLIDFLDAFPGIDLLQA